VPSKFLKAVAKLEGSQEFPMKEIILEEKNLTRALILEALDPSSTTKKISRSLNRLER
jgi:hypothetical protein